MLTAKKKINILVTGATGLVGQAILRYIITTRIKGSVNDVSSYNLYALVRNMEKARQIFLYNPEIQFIVGDITDESIFQKISVSFDYIIHCAAITQSRIMVEKPVDVLDNIVTGTRNVLRFAQVQHIKSMVYISSMEVYGVIDKEEVREVDLGYIEIPNSRSCYPMGKRMAESLCYSFYTQYGVPVKIARLAQTFGLGTPYEDTRVFAQFARSAVNQENIVLHTQGHTVGNYIDTEDSASAIWKLLIEGKDGESYNISNPSNCLTIRSMAALVAHKIAEDRIQVVFNIPKSNVYGYPKPTGWRLNVDKIMHLGWKPKYTLQEMYERMISGWK